MPLYYFHISNGNGFTEDVEGRDCPDLDAARVVAIAAARDIMASDIRRGLLDLCSFVEIEDEEKQLRVTVPFGEAVDLTKR